jgi:hypothetical protein
MPELSMSATSTTINHQEEVIMNQGIKGATTDPAGRIARCWTTVDPAIFLLLAAS